MTFDDLEIGQHLWVTCNDELLIVAKFNDHQYEACGAWECGIDPEACEIVQLIERPIGYEETSLYYQLE